jgi:hypothetical protein
MFETCCVYICADLHVPAVDAPAGAGVGAGDTPAEVAAVDMPAEVAAADVPAEVAAVDVTAEGGAPAASPNEAVPDRPDEAAPALPERLVLLMCFTPIGIADASSVTTLAEVSQ